MSNLYLINKTSIDYPGKIDHMKRLKRKIEELSAEYDLLKKQIVTEYFELNHTDILKNDKGLVLATYKTQLRTQFKSSDLKKNEPSLYEKYLDISEIKVFLIK